MHLRKCPHMEHNLSFIQHIIAETLSCFYQEPHSSPGLLKGPQNHLTTQEALSVGKAGEQEPAKGQEMPAYFGNK